MIIITVSVFLIFSLGSSVFDLWSRRDVLTVRQEKLTELEKEHKQLEKKLAEVETPGFIEQEARERLGMSKPGETVVILDTELSKEEGMPMKSGEVLPNWKQWWRIFF